MVFFVLVFFGWDKGGVMRGVGLGWVGLGDEGGLRAGEGENGRLRVGG